MNFVESVTRFIHSSPILGDQKLLDNLSSLKCATGEIGGDFNYHSLCIAPL